MANQSRSPLDITKVDIPTSEDEEKIDNFLKDNLSEANYRRIKVRYDKLTMKQAESLVEFFNSRQAPMQKEG